MGARPYAELVTCERTEEYGCEPNFGLVLVVGGVGGY